MATSLAAAPLASARTLQRHLPNSDLVVSTDAAYMTCIEQPAQLNRALRLFLNANSAAV